jgi:rare lipoprotein A (peptidoglycan hydrolase)
MSGLRRPKRIAGASALAALVAMPMVGCSESTPPAGVPVSQGQPSPASQSSSSSSSSTTTTAPGVSTPPGAGSAAAVSPEARTSRPVPPAHPVPAAFRPAPGAPSDAEVQRELAQMAAVQRRQREQALSAAAANLAGLLPWSLEPKSGVRSSVASVFTDYGLGLACGGLLGRNQLGVAHKTAPCGTLVTFTYAGRSLTVPVIDRGPYIVGREWDLTGATAAALAFPGLGRIQWSLAG